MGVIACADPDPIGFVGRTQDRAMVELGEQIEEIVWDAKRLEAQHDVPSRRIGRRADHQRAAWHQFMS